MVIWIDKKAIVPIGTCWRYFDNHHVCCVSEYSRLKCWRELVMLLNCFSLRRMLLFCCIRRTLIVTCTSMARWIVEYADIYVESVDSDAPEESMHPSRAKICRSIPRLVDTRSSRIRGQNNKMWGAPNARAPTSLNCRGRHVTRLHSEAWSYWRAHGQASISI